MFKARLFSGLAVGTSVAAVASFTALSGGTAHAAGVVLAQPMGGDNGSTASSTGTGASTTWTLTTGTGTADPAGAATVQTIDPPKDLSTATPPTFTVSSGTPVAQNTPGSGNPRWVITLSNGCSIQGGTTGSATATSAAGGWTAINDEEGYNPPASWSEALTAVGGTSAASGTRCSSGAHVTEAFVIADNPASTTYRLTNVTFGGSPVINDATVPVKSESATGRISNFGTGKCLDVPNGEYKNGEQLQQWACGASFHGVAGANQNFRIVDLSNGDSFLVARSPSGGLWGVDSPGAGKRLTLTFLDTEHQMTKQGAFYHFPGDEVDMTALGANNGGGVVGLARVPDNAQRWHNPEP